MQKLKIGFVLFLLVIIGSSCKKINQITEKAKEHYTVSGVIYDVDGITPSKNLEILLSRSYVPVLAKNKEIIIGKTITDNEGNFTLIYTEIPELSGYGLEIWANTVNGLFAQTDIISCIPPNENIEVFGCLNPQFKYNLTIKNQQFYKNDTLFFSSKFYNESNRIQGHIFNGISSLKEPFGNYIILGYDSLYNFREESRENCISKDYTEGSDASKNSVDEYFIIYAIGAKEFEKILNEPFDNLQNKIPFQRKPFPEITELVIDLKK